jgi:hypothetical protein
MFIQAGLSLVDFQETILKVSFQGLKATPLQL